MDLAGGNAERVHLNMVARTDALHCYTVKDTHGSIELDPKTKLSPGDFAETSLCAKGACECVSPLTMTILPLIDHHHSPLKSAISCSLK
mmetsp:Transcript_43509/g.83043  ORF Transcript_43509/g.83043 Transcript_43509/m.83043 type:complete len:89 (+) Transcript_43509:2604-2870(+)